MEKGKPVLVSGEARLSTWTSKQGEMKAAIGLDVRQLVLLGGGQKTPVAASSSDEFGGF
jgi:single-stranded DNA-binding protein